MTRAEELEIVAASLVPSLNRDGADAEKVKSVVYSQFVDGLAAMNGFAPLTETEKNMLCGDLAFRLLHVRTLKESVFAERYEPWLEAAKPDIKFYFWKDYYNHLLNDKHFDKDTSDSIDRVTDRIIDLCGDPRREGGWLKRGMVVGQVQSGKTADYIGVMTKAADCGYKVIVVLAGIQNTLRSQTQQRIDEGFIGKSMIESVDENGRVSYQEQIVGVGKTAGSRPYSVLSLTTLQSDFTGKTARAIASMHGNADNTVYAAVIKKNPSSLKAIVKWMDKSMAKRPMLLIDDEADNASVNYRDSSTPTTINGLIRDLLNKFQKAVYLGYTATPFANIFIDPDAVTAEHGEDLFPKDFIVTLDAPDRYFGPQRIFGENVKPEDDVLRTIKDHNAVLPLRHQRTHLIDNLPGSLKESIAMFVLATAIRMCRGQVNCPSSALVNVSRFIDVHDQVYRLVIAEVERLKKAIKIYGLLDPAKSSTMLELFDLFNREYGASGVAWDQLKEHLFAASDPIEVLEINMKSDAKKLDYSREKYPHGRKVIAVGGFSLSRGLTLEGLCVSYFLRNSRMYDTLMQMGRWFGYRHGYNDLCRIYMTEDAQAWYRHITMALAELWDEFKEMEKAKLTPSDFGLRVRAHPLNLIVTARNKMQSAREVVVKIDLSGKQVETSALMESKLEANHALLVDFVKSLGVPNGNPAPCLGQYWSRVPSKSVVDFIKKFKYCNQNMTEAIGPLCEYMGKLASLGIDTSDVYLASVEGGLAENIAGHTVLREERSVNIDGDFVFIGNNRRVGSPQQERCGLSDIMKTQDYKDAESARSNGGKKAITGSFYRMYRERPLLILHVLRTYQGKRVKEAQKFMGGAYDAVVAWGLSFPDRGAPGDESNMVSYVLNPIAFRQWRDSDDADEEEVGEE